MQRRFMAPLLIALALVPPLLTAWVLWIAPLDGIATNRTALAARDFTAFWAAGRLAAQRSFDILADPAAFTAYLRALFGPAMPDQIWPYPPTMLLLARPFATLSPGTGFALYIALSIAALAAALRLNGLTTTMTAAILLSPAVATSLLTGQNGCLTAALLAAGLLSIERRPMLAGFLLGALCIKPQFALLLPICLWANRRTSAALVSCVVALFLALLSLREFGSIPWVDFFGQNRSNIETYVGSSWQAAPSQTMFSSVFMAARSLGAKTPVAYTLQCAATCLCGLAAWRLWSNPAIPTHRRAAATMALTLLASPWVHTYDMPALAVAIVLVFRRERPLTMLLLGFAWCWPGLSSLTSVAPLLSVLAVAGVLTVAMVPSWPAQQPA